MGVRYLKMLQSIEKVLREDVEVDPRRLGGVCVEYEGGSKGEKILERLGG